MNIRSGCFIICVAGVTGGCADPGRSGQSYESLMNPARLHESTERESRASAAGQIPVDNYYSALTLARPVYAGNADPAPADRTRVRNYVNEGLALVEAYCMRWFRAIEDQQRHVDLAQKDFNVIQQLGTALLGIGKASSNWVTGYGAGFTAYNGIVNNYAAAFLAAPTTKKIKGEILDLLNQSGTALKNRANTATDDAPLLFSEAYAALEKHADICTFATIRELLDTRLSDPDKKSAIDTDTGKISTVTIAATFQRDDATDRLAAFWMPGGRLDPANDTKLRAWMKSNGMENVSPVLLVNGKEYAAQRQKAVDDLSVPEVKK